MAIELANRRQGANIQTKVEELEELNQSFRNRDKMKDDAIAQLSDQLMAISIIRNTNNCSFLFIHFTFFILFSKERPKLNIKTWTVICKLFYCNHITHILSCNSECSFNLFLQTGHIALSSLFICNTLQQYCNQNILLIIFYMFDNNQIIITS
jgi:hypothetical protein